MSNNLLKKRPKISVIVPIYNTEEFLNSCLQSIASQSYRDYEVLMIDDGSSDNSSCICRKYEDQDSRFHYFYQENQGLASARNFALSFVQGDYISFVDSDDYLDENFLRDLLSTIKDTKSDVAVCQFYVWEYPYALPQNLKSTNSVDQCLCSQKIFLKGIFSLKNRGREKIISGGHVTNKLFRAELLQGIQFEKSVVEDEPFLFLLSRRINQVAYVHSRLYYYRQRRGSSIYSPGFSRNLLDVRIKLLTRTSSEAEESCVRTAVFNQIFRCVLEFFKDRDFSVCELCHVHKASQEQLAFVTKDIRVIDGVTRFKWLTICLFSKIPCTAVRKVFPIVKFIFKTPNIFESIFVVRSFLKRKISNYKF